MMSWPVRRILRGAARMALGEPAGDGGDASGGGRRRPEVRILHEGREGVERAGGRW